MSSPLDCTPKYAMTRVSIDFAPREEYIGTGGFYLSLTRCERVRGHLRWLGVEESRGIRLSSLFFIWSCTDCDIATRIYRVLLAYCRQSIDILCFKWIARPDACRCPRTENCPSPLGGAYCDFSALKNVLVPHNGSLLVADGTAEPIPGVRVQWGPSDAITKKDLFQMESVFRWLRG